MSRYILSDAPQGTDEWKLARAGRATGSRAADVCAKLKGGGEAAIRRNYRVQLVAERLLGAPAEDGFESADMRWGKEQEPFARMAYEAETGLVVREAGFAYLPALAAGCSVDGLIEDQDGEGILECKCPKTATHVAYLLGGRIPPEYLAQVTHNVWITGASYADFVSFDPRLPVNVQLLRVRTYRKDLDIVAHEEEVLRFLDEVDQLESQLRARGASPLALAA